MTTLIGIRNLYGVVVFDSQYGCFSEVEAGLWEYLEEEKSNDI